MNLPPPFTNRPFDVQIVANGVDVTAASPIVGVFYGADGTGTRTMRDGRTIAGQWRFINPGETQIEVQGPEGTTRWVVVELTDTVYRKVNVDTGVEFIHRPRTASA